MPAMMFLSATSSPTPSRDTMAQSTNSFGPRNQGTQVGQNYGAITTQIHLPPERPETPPQPYANIPFSRDPLFVDRGDILDRIDQRLREPSARLALAGLGGVGKSQLAIEYAYRFARMNPNVWVFWIHASTRARVEDGFETIADNIKLPDWKQAKEKLPWLVYRWLSDQRNGKWLLVLDSADDADVFYEMGGNQNAKLLAECLPQSPNGSILVTTRDTDLGRRLANPDDPNAIMVIDVMAQSESLRLLEHRLGTIKDTEREMAAELVTALENVPLAISQAGGYIHARGRLSSLSDYLKKLQNSDSQRARLLEHGGGDSRRNVTAMDLNAILPTWQISFEYIHAKRRSAADLLSLMSFFDRQGIPESCLKPLRAAEDGDKAGGSQDETNDEFEEDLFQLQNFCLITVNEDRHMFDMHRLVQLSTKRWLGKCGLHTKFIQQYVERLAVAFPEPEYDNWAECQKLFPHVELALGYPVAEKEYRKIWARLLHYGGEYAVGQGRYDVAERMAYQAKSTREEELGKEHEETWHSMADLAATYWRQGRWKEAEILEVEVLEYRKARLGEDHPDTLTSMADLATTYWRQGRWEKAEVLGVQALEGRKARLGEDHPQTLTIMNNLAIIYRDQGRWEEAEVLGVQALENRKARFGKDHPYTLTIMNNLALIYRDQGRWEEAEVLGVQALEGRKARLGEDHPHTLTSMHNLAYTWRDLGREVEALALMKDCLQHRQRVLGRDHPHTRASLKAFEKWSGNMSAA